jgi:hypothetical protein
LTNDLRENEIIVPIKQEFLIELEQLLIDLVNNKPIRLELVNQGKRHKISNLVAKLRFLIGER